MLFMSACVVTTQFVIALIASWSDGRRNLGSKALLLIAFAVLPIRGVLYTSRQYGIARGDSGHGRRRGGIFGVMSVLVIAD